MSAHSMDVVIPECVSTLSGQSCSSLLVLQGNGGQGQDNRMPKSRGKTGKNRHDVMEMIQSMKPRKGNGLKKTQAVRTLSASLCNPDPLQMHTTSCRQPLGPSVCGWVQPKPLGPAFLSIHLELYCNFQVSKGLEFYVNVSQFSQQNLAGRVSRSHT